MNDNVNTADSNVFATDCSALDMKEGCEGQMHHPKYETLESRRLTFRNWKTGTGQTPQNLAEAGFFSTNREDEVCCFYCNMKLWKWKSNDLPWDEHVKLNNECQFAVQILGRDKIKSILNSQRTKEKQESHSNLKKIGYSTVDIGNALKNVQGAGPLSEDKVMKAAEDLRRNKYGAPGDSSNAGTCISCNDTEHQVLFLPCKHTILCNQCADKVDTCIKCNTPIAQKLQVFLS